MLQRQERGSFSEALRWAESLGFGLRMEGTWTQASDDKGAVGM